MTDLNDGESVEMKGSAARPYVLKNVAGVYSCSCPAWRNQSLPIERRTCKHLRLLRSDAAEESRIGSQLPMRSDAIATRDAPPLLLAETWDGHADPTGWLMSEKLDGVRAYWDGRQFWSRQGNRYFAPAWFTEGLPRATLDGELWLGRRQFSRTVSIVRRQDQSDLWKEIRYLVFDAPEQPGGFEARLRFVERALKETRPRYAIPHTHVPCDGFKHVQSELTRIEGLGGEGLMLRQPGSAYVVGRSSTLLKVKRFLDAEARVVAHQPGAGRHKGRLGAFLVELASGVRFALGTGLKDAERENPPPIGSMVRCRYQELSDGGVPRFPTYAGLCDDDPVITNPTRKGGAMPTTACKRRFEFTDERSDKFWEVTLRGAEVHVRFGRNGTHGQTEARTFRDAAAAAQFIERKCNEKLKKGYREISP